MNLAEQRNIKTTASSFVLKNLWNFVELWRYFSYKYIDNNDDEKETNKKKT